MAQSAIIADAKWNRERLKLASKRAPLVRIYLSMANFNSVVVGGGFHRLAKRPAPGGGFQLRRLRNWRARCLMTSTRIVSDADISVGRAAGYEMSPDGALRNQAWVAPALNRTADGSLDSTVQDLARWDAALSTHEILTAAELERMWTVEPLHDGRRPFYNYGYGWEINSWRGQRVIEYDGNWQGFQAAMARYPVRELTVIVLTNLSLCRTQRIVHSVAALFDPALARSDAVQEDAHPRLTNEFAQFLAAAARGAPTSLPLTSAGRERLSPVWIAALGRDLRAFGPTGATTLVSDATYRGVLERVSRVETKDMVDFFTVRYATAGRVEQVSVDREY
jgi:hypothetical protein